MTYQEQRIAFSPTSDWNRLGGQRIELRRAGTPVWRGVVDVAMPDGTGFWLAAEGPDARVYLHNDGELDLWVERATE